MASKCRKFVPNMFNKTKCQSCFGSKEQHSAEALESNKQSRKVSKCGYLFVAPGYDFSNPLDKSKRWQRRFFVLYDDGELAYSVDENPDTVPQGVVDMNKCTDVKDASGSTSHSNSMAIITPEKTTYIKGNSKEEIQWWYNILIKFPDSNVVQKPKFLFDSSNKENISPVSSKSDIVSSTNSKNEIVGPSNGKKDNGGSKNGDMTIVCPPSSKEIDVPDSLISPKSDSSESTGDEPKSRFEVEKVKPKEQGFSTYRGVRSMKHTKADKHHQEGLRKSSSLHDLTTEEKETGSLDKSRFLSRSGDRLDSTEDIAMYSDSARLLSGYGTNPYATLPRDLSLKPPFTDRSLQSSMQDSSSNSSIASAPSQTSISEGTTRQRRGSFDDKTSKPRNASERARMHRERSASMKSFPTGLTLPKIPSNVGASSVDRLLPRRDSGASAVNENETDEHKMAKSTEMQAVSRPTPPPQSPTRTTGPGTKFESLHTRHNPAHLACSAKDLMYMKKGWLIKMGTSEKDWKKHWFVLTGNSLRYYKDAKAEETNALDGRIDLSSCYDIAEVQIQRNYGFKIKTRNGEYTLSAMTSGIRSNWMKAIRLCMDLQSSNKNNQSKPADLPAASAMQRPNDDIDITPSPSLGNSENTRSVDKKDFSRRNVRRHYSDVNPGNINKMFSIKGLGLDKSLNKPSSSSSSSSISSKEPSVERDVQKEQANKVHMDTGAVSKHAKYEQYWSAEGNSGIPFRRFVEGSDNEVSASLTGNEKSEDKQEEEDRKQRAKSPSAKIKDRSRAKSPKLHSPPPGQSQESKFSFRQSASQDNTDKLSDSSDELDFADGTDDQIHLDADDNMPTTMSSAGEGMLVDLLENEVESLKERLEHTQQELAKSHDSNRDLKTKLQTVVREKDPAQLQASLDSSYTAALSPPASDAQQINTMKRQLKESKDTVHRQKSEIDQLKSKLDMSVSKLTGTEKALSEALKDVKQEKDKFLKVSTEYNRKVRALEGNLKDVTQKMEKYHENSLIKDKENRKLDLELKQQQQRVRENDREILKLKAVEHEYRQMKEKFDETEKYVSRLRSELKEKDGQYKKLEIEYEEQFENMMQDFTKERDDTEHHIEELKNQLLETQRKTSMSEQVSSNVADLLREKDEIIAQLEEKVIESETKMVELTEDLKADEDEATALNQNIEILEEERDNGIEKIKDLEKALSFHHNQMQRMEKENASIRKHMDDLRKENTELGERLDCEKSDVTSLVEDNDSLKSNVKDLEQEVHCLHQKLTEVLNHEKLAHSSIEASPDNMQTVVLANSDLDQVKDSILALRKQVDSNLSNCKGESKTHFKDVAEKLEDIGRKCESVSEFLTTGKTEHSVQIQKQNTGTLESKPEVKQNIAKDENKTELEEMKKKFSNLSAENKKLKENMSEIDKQYESHVQTLSKRMDDIAAKKNVKVDEKSPKEKPRKLNKRVSVPLPDAIEANLIELEEKIELVEKVLQANDLSTGSVGTEGQAETEEEGESDSDESDAFTDSEEETETETETEDEGTSEGSDGLLGKLKEMKRQLEHTNLKVKEITREIHGVEPSRNDSQSKVEEELRQTLLKCEEKVNSITSRMSDGLKFARTETPHFSDQTWAFQKCVSKLKEKVTEVSIMTHEHDELNHKELKNLQEKVQYLVAYINEVDKIGENDWDVAGKIAKQELKFQHLLAHKEVATKKSSLKYEDRLQLYADKLAFEAMILGQMGILIQRQQVGVVYKDVLLREIHEANLNILDLERRIDTTTREMNPSDEEKDLVSSYAAMLAEKIVLEGQLASCAMVQDLENSENVEVLQALNIDESPTVLAMEIFIRSQLDTSVNDQLLKFAESMDKVSNHIVTRALFQGEISHALKVVKRKFKTGSESEDLPSLVKRERQFAFEQLDTRHVNILDLLNETEPLIMTTLIQLIEYTQGPNSPTLDSVCDKITSIVNEKMKTLEKDLETAESDTKGKVTNIISHLHSELEDAIVIFREEYHCYVQTASPDINPNMLKFSVDSVCKDLAGMLIQKAVINGSYDFIANLNKKMPEVPVSQMMDPLSAEGEGLSDLAKCLGQIMLTEASNKQSLANDVRNMSEGNASSIKDLVAVIPDLEAYPQSFDAYAATLVREAMFQSQLTYTTYKLKLQYHRQLRDIRLKLESGEKVVLPSEISREAESDIQVSMTTFEEILNTKYQDECAVLEELEKEIGKLKSVSSEKSCSKCKSFEINLKQLEKTFQHEVSVAQERQNVHSDVLRQEVKNVILRVDKFLEDHEKEKEKMIEDYEDRIATLQDEFELMRVDHEDELEQVKLDIMTAVSAIKATEEEAETSSVDQLKHHNKQLIKLVAMSKEVMSDVKPGSGISNKGELKEKVDTLLSNITQLETDPTLALDISLSLSSPETPSSPPAFVDAPPLDRTLSAERSDENVDKLLERSQHEHEMEQLKREKEAALADEIKVTKAALDAMRKAYEEELEQEKDKYRHALKTMFTDNYVEDIRRRHEIEAERLRVELKQISMHYESKCEDYKLLEDRLSRTKLEYQAHINQLVKSNEHLTEHVNNEIEELKKFIQTRNKGTLTGSATMEEELYDSQIMVRVKDAELQKLRSQVKNLENSLERTTEEQRYTMTQYLTCLKKNQELQAKLKEEVLMSKERRDSTAQDEQTIKNARALRRNPSFHQRARSPSPETSPRKDNAEHHSRDSHRRSRGHLSAKDLKRSQSSPSLPYVFEAKSGLGRGGQTSTSARRESTSAKYSKSPKK